MKLREKGRDNKALIISLEKMGLEKKSNVWKALAKALNRPKRAMSEVNLSRLEKEAAKGETMVVPGKVLGVGNVTKAISVAALHFSQSAEKAIEKAGGKCLTIPEVLGKNPNGKGLRIIG